MSNPLFADIAVSATTVINHPLDVVWPYLLNQATWMTEYRIESVGGERNKEGELKKVMHLEPGFEDFFFRTLLLIPFRKFVYKAFTENRNGSYGFTGIEALSLNDHGSGSAIIFEAYLEVQSASMTREQLWKFCSEAKKGSIETCGRNFERLASLIGSSVRSEAPLTVVCN
jgi:hypothetical protein